MDNDITLSEARRDKLADLVIQRYHDARSARNSAESYGGQTVEAWLTECFDRYMKRRADYFALTRIKVGALHAKVKDMVINAADAPFTIEPTPVPQLSQAQRAQVQSGVIAALGAKLIENNIAVMDEATGQVWPDYERIYDPQTLKVYPVVAGWLEEQVKAQATTMQVEAQRIAKKAAAYTTTLMQDQMLEGGWRDAYLDCLFDIFLYGTGCLRMEQRRVQALKWRGDALKPSTQDIITWRHVPVANCYPSSDSEHAQEGTYFIERGAMRKQDLFAATQIDWVDADRVAEAYERASDNYDWLADGGEQRVRWGDDTMIDVLIHEGTVRGDALLEWFGEDEGTGEHGIKSDAFYDVEAWVLADVVIGCRILKHPDGMRSYFSANFQRAGRNFWGIGAGMTLAELEDRLNGYLDDLAKNLELAVGPPIFYDAGRFDDPAQITLAKRAKIPFNPDNTGSSNAPPFYQPHFDSRSAELINLFNWGYRLADDESGIPGLLSGNNQLAGGEATFRGMKMLAASANTLIKDAFLNIDQTLIQPAMQALWRWNMLYTDDPNIKADTVIVARGAAGLMMREIAEAERNDVLPTVVQLVQGAGLAPEQTQAIMRYLLRETMQAGGVPVDELMPNAEAAAEQNGVVASLQPATPQPTIGADNDTGGLNAY